MAERHLINDPLDMKQIFFSIICELGFDKMAMEAKNKIVFNENMFDLPNKRGAEVVLHFLFNRLNPVMCREEFRDCWPISDKKQEMQFRKTCSNWLTNIAKEEPDAHLPRISASLFMSPGGDKFYQLMFHFSRYVLQRILETELGMKGRDQLKYPILTSQTINMGDMMGKAVQGSVVRHRKKYLEEAQEILMVNKIWKDYANDLVKDHRMLKKEDRELDYEIRAEEQKGAERGVIRGSPMVKRRKSNQIDYDFDPRSIQRAQRVQQVRDKWKQLDDFYTTEAAEREVIESIVEKTIHKYKIDAGDINIKVPDMLLRECEEEIRRRHVDNTYQGGKLNLVSVAQLWNLCLHLYIEKLHQVGVPNFEEDVKAVTSQVHTQHAYLVNAQTLRRQMSEMLPELKESVESLRAKLNTEVLGDLTPQSLRTTSVGVGLTEPTPPTSFSPRADTDATTPSGARLKYTPDDVSTPEAAAVISERVTATVRKGPDTLFQGTPVFEPTVTGSQSSKLPTAMKKSQRGVGSQQKQSTPIKSAIHRLNYNQNNSAVSAQQMVFDTEDGQRSPAMSSPRSARSGRSGRSTASHTSLASGKRSDRGPDPMNSPRSVRSDVSFKSSSTITDMKHGTEEQGRRTPTDYIVDEIMGEAEIISPVESGQEAFVSRDKLARTPEQDSGTVANEVTQSPRSGVNGGQSHPLSPPSPTDEFVDRLLQQSPETPRQESEIQTPDHSRTSQLSQDFQQMYEEAVKLEGSPHSSRSSARSRSSAKPAQENNGVMEEVIEVHQTPEKEYITGDKGNPMYRQELGLADEMKDAQQRIVMNSSISSKGSHHSKHSMSSSGSSQKSGAVSQEQANDLYNIENQLIHSDRSIHSVHSQHSTDLKINNEAEYDKRILPTEPEVVKDLEELSLHSERSRSSKHSSGAQVEDTAGSPLEGSPQRVDVSELEEYADDDEDKENIEMMIRTRQQYLKETLGQVTRSPLKEGMVRSPLTEEIRKMFQEALADDTPSGGKQTAVTKPVKVASDSEEGLFLEQVELEELVVGEEIVRKDSSYFSESGYLAKRFDDLALEHDEQRRHSSHPEPSDGGLSDDAEPSPRNSSKLRKEDISWDADVNIEDVELPDVGLDDSVSEFFQTNAPSTQKSKTDIVSEDNQPGSSLRTDSSSISKPKFPLSPPGEEEYDLMSFKTPRSVIGQSGFSGQFMVDPPSPGTVAAAMNTSYELSRGCGDLREEFEQMLNTSRELIRQAKLDLSLTMDNEDNFESKQKIEEEQDEVQPRLPHRTLHMDDVEDSPRHGSPREKDDTNRNLNATDTGVNDFIEVSPGDPEITFKIKKEPSALSAMNSVPRKSTEVDTKEFVQEDVSSSVKKTTADFDEFQDLNLEEEDLDLMGPMNDSFAPLKEGFKVEGGTPIKKSGGKLGLGNEASQNGDGDDMFARLNKIRQATASLQKEYVSEFSKESK